MTPTNDDMNEFLAAAPVGIVRASEDGTITWANETAFELMGCTVGQQIDEFIHPDAAPRFRQLRSIPGDTAELRLRARQGSKAASVVATDVAQGEQCLFFSDISERVALARQLRATQEPGRKILHQLHTANTTMTGYTELISVMLEEEASLEGERLTVVRRYHQEIRRCQQTIDRLLKVARHGGKRPDSNATISINRRHIVVVDDEAPLADYVTELMRGLQHKVTTFNDANEAARFIRTHASEINLVITDYTMPSLSGLDLATQAHAVRGDLPILICPEQELSIDDNEHLFQCRKPIDINDLIQIVSELVDH